jgi:hypothetical protein
MGFPISVTTLKLWVMEHPPLPLNNCIISLLLAELLTYSTVGKITFCSENSRLFWSTSKLRSIFNPLCNLNASYDKYQEGNKSK